MKAMMGEVLGSTTAKLTPPMPISQATPCWAESCRNTQSKNHNGQVQGSTTYSIRVSKGPKLGKRIESQLEEVAHGCQDPANTTAFPTPLPTPSALEQAKDLVLGLPKILTSPVQASTGSLAQLATWLPTNSLQIN